MAFSGVDVGDHRVDRGVGVGHQASRVSANRVKAADGLTQAKQIVVSLKHGGFGAVGHVLRQAGQHRAQPFHSAMADIDFARRR